MAPAHCAMMYMSALRAGKPRNTLRNIDTVGLPRNDQLGYFNQLITAIAEQKYH